MHLGRVFGFLAVALSSALPVALAQQKNGDNVITNPPAGQALPAGKNIDITWNPTTKGTISLFLVKGTAGDLKELFPITNGAVNNGKFTWAPDLNLQGLQTMDPAAGYSIKIVDDSTKNFNEGGLWKLDSPNSTFQAPPSSAAGATTHASATTQAPPTSQTAPASATTPATTPATTETSAPPTTSETVPPTTLSTATVAETSTVASTTETPTSSQTPASTSSAPSSTSNSAEQATSSSTASASATATPAKKMKTVTIVGIAAGVVVVVVAIVVGIILFMRRKRVDRESKMFGGAPDPNYLRNSGYKPQTSYDSEFAMMERQRPYAEFQETGPYSSTSPQQPEHIGMARF